MFELNHSNDKTFNRLLKTGIALWLIYAILFFIILIGVIIFIFSHVSGTVIEYNDNGYYWTSDLTVNSNERVYMNNSIITIESADINLYGDLFLNNTKLYFNCASDKECEINNNGYFNINYSIITVNNTSNDWTFGNNFGTIECNNSYITDCDDFEVDSSTAISRNYTIIKNTHIYYRGVYSGEKVVFKNTNQRKIKFDNCTIDTISNTYSVISLKDCKVNNTELHYSNLAAVIWERTINISVKDRDTNLAIENYTVIVYIDGKVDYNYDETVKYFYNPKGSIYVITMIGNRVGGVGNYRQDIISNITVYADGYSSLGTEGSFKSTNNIEFLLKPEKQTIKITAETSGQVWYENADYFVMTIGITFLIITVIGAVFAIGRGKY